MTISSSVFLPYYLVFLLLGILERVVSTFIKKELKPTKYTLQKWLFFLPFSTYLLIVICAVAEHIFLVKTTNLYITGFGGLFFISGVLIRRKAIADLADNWSVYIEIKQDHTLIHTGLYNFLKHPYCLAVFLELIGICLIGNSFYSLMLVFVIQAPLLLTRAAFEEKALVHHFGDLYVAYRKGKFL
jgi:protein-S-isoprenylcysteine O-methyltransferase Ste14